MKKSDFMAALLLMCFLPVQLFAKQASSYQIAPDPIYVRPLVQVSDALNQRLILLSSSFDFTTVWRISLRNLSNERVVVNNLIVNTTGNQDIFNSLSARLVLDQEPLAEDIEGLGDGLLFFRDIYVVLMPGQIREVELKIATLQPIGRGFVRFNMQADGFTGFAASNLNLGFTGRFPYISRTIQIGHSGIFLDQF